MTVQVRLFAILRQRAGRDSIVLELAQDATVADALRALAGEPGLGELVGRMPLGVAVNREYAKPDARLCPGDELALIPPVSGGAVGQGSTAGQGSGAGAAADGAPGAGVHVRVSDRPLSLEDVAGAVRHPGAGATVVFVGTTRTVERLDYEAYEEMARMRIEAILDECVQRHGLKAAAAEHRTGSVVLGEASVMVAVSAAHRAQAFAGAREAIDRIKAEAPIWKREIEDGERAYWVQGTPAPGALTHVDGQGSVRMVDVGAKDITARVARARAWVRMSKQCAAAVEGGQAPKGEVLGTARLAGIQAAKRTDWLIPLAHTIELTHIGVDASLDVEQGLVELTSEVQASARTGVEMEAMTACAVAALTVYDMVKGFERGVEIEQVALLEKTGGRSDWRRADD